MNITKTIFIDGKQQKNVYKVYVNVKQDSLLWNHPIEPWQNMARNCHYLTHSKMHVQPEGYQQPHNEVGSQNPIPA